MARRVGNGAGTCPSWRRWSVSVFVETMMEFTFPERSVDHGFTRISILSHVHRRGATECSGDGAGGASGSNAPRLNMTVKSRCKTRLRRMLSSLNCWLTDGYHPTTRLSGASLWAALTGSRSRPGSSAPSGRGATRWNGEKGDTMESTSGRLI